MYIIKSNAALQECFRKYSDSQAQGLLWNMFPGEAVKYPTKFGTKQVQHKTPVQHIKNAIMNLNLNAKVSVIWECVCQCRASDI